MKWKRIIVVGLLAAAPLVASGVLEVFDIGQVRETSCGGGPAIRVDLVRTDQSYSVAKELDLRVVAMASFQPLSWGGIDRRLCCYTQFRESRELWVVMYDPQTGNWIAANELEKERIRKVLIDYAIAKGHSSSVVEELQKPDVHRSGIWWPGVYFNGAFTIALLGGIGWLLWRLYLVSPLANQDRRLRQGHCPTCTYDLRGEMADGCPECGWLRQ